MLPKIDPTKSEPIYAQLMSEIKYFIATELMKPGELLPSVRDLAVKLRINPNTVARAYRELEHEGVVVTVPGKGVYVSDGPRTWDKERARAELGAALDALLVEAYHRGVSAEHLKTLLEERTRNFHRRGKQDGLRH
ncbi:MAG: GntR family transcriptional regulator [Candidatus Abyssubacteria bacterium]